jgi:hypothetical protein
MEQGTDINATRVDKVYSAVLDALNAGKTISAQAELVYQIEMLSQEVNSGASFEQYFRWARVTRDSRILQYLKDLGLPEVSEIVERAFKAAFPDGIPEDDDDYELCMEWSEEQEQQLASLFAEFEHFNGVITNKLGRFIKQHKVTVLAPDELRGGEPEAPRKDVDPRSILAELGQILDPDNLSEIQRNVWLAWRFDCGIGNGGFGRHFMDSDSARLDQSLFVSALRQVGAEQHAVILEQAVARMPKGLSMTEASHLLWEQCDGSGLEDLEAALAGCSIRLVDLLEFYAVEHIENFTYFIK